MRSSTETHFPLSLVVRQDPMLDCFAGLTSYGSKDLTSIVQTRRQPVQHLNPDQVVASRWRTEPIQLFRD